MRLVEALVRRLARGAGTTRLGVRVRPTSAPSTIVVAYPWRHRSRAVALGEAVAAVLDQGPQGIEDAIGVLRASDLGPGPTTLRPRVPVVAVTGTNGKTTTSRMIAHIARTSGLLTGWSNTDGIYIDGELIEAGDYSGPSGAGRVLAGGLLGYPLPRRRPSRIRARRGSGGAPHRTDTGAGSARRWPRAGHYGHGGRGRLGLKR